MLKPTGGVILLNDTRPSEPKSLLELKVKKVVPAPTPGAAGPSGADAPEGVTTASSSGPANNNLVDEGEEEADMPGEFDYLSDGGEADDD
jgi:26S proteasome regulatory subunit N2